QQFTATVIYPDGSSQNLVNSVSWSSSNSAVASIDNSGKAAGVAPGTSMVVATAGSTTGSTNLTVAQAALVSITITPSSPTVALGQPIQFSALGTFADGTTQDLTAAVTRGSSILNIAGVTNAGVAVGAAAGIATITASAGAISSSASLTVQAPAVPAPAVITLSSGSGTPGETTT